MTKRKKSKIKKVYNKNKDIVIKLATFEKLESEGEKLLLENEMLSKDSFYLPTDEQKVNFRKLIYKQYLKYNIKKISNYTYKIAFIGFVFSMISYTYLVNVDAFRSKILGFDVERRRDATSFTGNIGVGNNGVEEYFVPTYVPEGFEMETVHMEDSNIRIMYINEENEYIRFEQRSAMGITMLIDTEDADKMEEMEINGGEAFLIVKNIMVHLMWQGDYLFTILSSSENVSEVDIIKMAESITIAK